MARRRHLAILLDGKATDGQLIVGRFDVSKGEAPPYHTHTREDEVFMLIKGTALLWYDDQEMELSEGGIVSCPRTFRTAYRITSDTADLLMINTPAGIEGMFRHAGRDRAPHVRKASKSPLSGSSKRRRNSAT